MDLGVSILFWGACAALLMGFAKTGLPGAAIPSVALMTQAFPDDARQAVGAMLPVLLVGDVFAVAYYRRHAQWGRLIGLFPYVLVGMLPAYALLMYVERNELRPVLGGLILTLFILEVCRRRYQWTQMPQSRWFAALMGVLAGFCTMVGNAAGPVMSIYLLSRGLQKKEFVGTCAWFFFIVNLTKVIPFWLQGMLNSKIIGFEFIIAPIVVIGSFWGIRMLPKIPQMFFDRLVLGLAGAAGVWLLVT